MNQINNKTTEDANKIANSTKKPNQTKQQTKLIAQGIQKGIELYKKQHKAKLREQDKLKKKSKASVTTELEAKVVTKHSKLAWGLLGGSWVIFAVYTFLKTTNMI